MLPKNNPDIWKRNPLTPCWVRSHLYRVLICSSIYIQTCKPLCWYWVSVTAVDLYPPLMWNDYDAVTLRTEHKTTFEWYVKEKRNQNVWQITRWALDYMQNVMRYKKMFVINSETCMFKKCHLCVTTYSHLMYEKYANLISLISETLGSIKLVSFGWERGQLHYLDSFFTQK